MLSFASNKILTFFFIAGGGGSGQCGGKLQIDKKQTNKNIKVKGSHWP